MEASAVTASGMVRVMRRLPTLAVLGFPPEMVPAEFTEECEWCGAALYNWGRKYPAENLVICAEHESIRGPARAAT